MSDHEFESYLGLLTRFLRLDTRQRDDIRRELRAHLEESIEAQISRGVSRKDAIRQALEDFGDAAELAARFSNIGWQKRWIMRGTAVAASIGIVALWSVFSSNEPTGRVMAEDGSANQVERAEVAKQGALSPDDIQRRLREEILPDARFDDQSLAAVISYLGEMTGINIHPFWSELEEFGIDRDVPVTMSLHNVSAKQVLDLIVREVSPHAPLVYVVRDEVLLISSPGMLNAPLETRSYDVRDLMSGFAIDAQSDQVRKLPSTDRFLMESLMKTITRVVEPSSWRCENGEGDLSDFQSIISIRQTPAIHAEVEELLQQIRDLKSADSRNPTAKAESEAHVAGR